MFSKAEEQRETKKTKVEEKRRINDKTIRRGSYGSSFPDSSSCSGCFSSETRYLVGSFPSYSSRAERSSFFRKRLEKFVRTFSLIRSQNIYIYILYSFQLLVEMIYYSRNFLFRKNFLFILFHYYLNTKRRIFRTYTSA